MRDTSPLNLHLLNPPLQVVRIEIRLHAWHKQRCVGEQVVHFLERAFRGLGQESPEEDGVGEIAYLITTTSAIRYSQSALGGMKISWMGWKILGLTMNKI
jgi:hypothetical protein